VLDDPERAASTSGAPASSRRTLTGGRREEDPLSCSRMRLCTLFALSCVSACGITAVGSGELVSGAIEDGGASPLLDGSAPSPVESGTDATPPVVTCSATGNACSGALEPGWTPIAFAGDRGAACPNEFTTVELVTNPLANAGACTCACQISATDPPTCAQGSFASTVGSTTSCSSQGISYAVNGTGCTALAQSGSLSAYGRYAALALDRGTCIASAKPDMSKVASNSVRACIPSAACVEDVCLGKPVGAFASCIVHDGDVPCPAAPSPFLERTLAGASSTLTCGGCATCQNNATCGTATLRFYNDGACATEVASRIANDVCNAFVTGSAGVTASHFRYDVATSNPSCAPTSTATAAAGLDQERTICCR
jgi:hypothetical protein